MLNRYDIQRSIEEWRDQCVDAGLDYGAFLVLYDDNMIKDLARHIIMKVREHA